MLENLHGSHYVLTHFSIWYILLALLILNYPVLYIGRKVFEGAYYNISWASKYGDLGLFGIILIGSEVLLREGVPSEFLRSGVFHVVCGIASISLGIYLLIRVHRQQGWLGEWMDIGHNGFFVPFMTYLLSTTLFVIFKCGSRDEMVLTCLLFLLWLILLGFDGLTGRLDQRPWMEEHLKFVPPKSRRKK